MTENRGLGLVRGRETTRTGTSAQVGLPTQVRSRPDLLGTVLREPGGPARTSLPSPRKDHPVPEGSGSWSQGLPSCRPGVDLGRRSRPRTLLFSKSSTLSREPGSQSLPSRFPVHSWVSPSYQKSCLWSSNSRRSTTTSVQEELIPLLYLGPPTSTMVDSLSRVSLTHTRVRGPYVDQGRLSHSSLTQVSVRGPYVDQGGFSHSSLFHTGQCPRCPSPSS